MGFCVNCGVPDVLCNCPPKYRQHCKHRPRTCNNVSWSDDENLCCDKKPDQHWKKCEPKPHCSPKKTCKESLSELISSAASIENALANTINAESHILKEGNFTPEQLLVLTNKL